jgi:hypothetical protein
MPSRRSEVLVSEFLRSALAIDALGVPELEARARAAGLLGDARTTRHPGYRISTIKRKRIEEPFGWMKTVGGLRKTRHRGRGLVEWFFVLTATAYNLIRIPKILAATG